MKACKVFFQTPGCKVNQYESKATAELFAAAGLNNAVIHYESM